MISLPQSLRRIIKELAELPSIGPRQATRIAFHLVSKGSQRIAGLSSSLKELSNIKTCKACYFIFDSAGDLCEICANPQRDQTLIMVVEKETDLISLENTNKYKGRYFILGEMPKTGLLEDWQKERLASLKKSILNLPGKVAKEIILALNPTSIGDFHASILIRELADLTPKLSRLGRGLPSGGEIEFADDETLGSALQSRG
jgi:recombination protein RecR